MFALIYLVVMVMLGDLICRRFYNFISLPHRLAAAFLSGLLISSWFTYLAALLFMRSSKPLLWGNLLFIVAAISFILFERQRTKKLETVKANSPRTTGADKWDWAFIGIFLIVACWQMFSTFSMADGKLRIANHQWSDFGPNVAISQSFALGHNFPTEYPHYSGERILYHFLYYFQVGNLEYLGLNPALSNNLLSIFSLVSMLILVMTLGVVLFNSRAVGRIGAALFFFHGTLSYIPFIKSQGSIGNVINKVLTMPDFLPSIFPYRGELWGIWSQVVFINQRHFASSIGILLLVLVFLFTRYRDTSLDKNFDELKQNQTDALLEFVNNKESAATEAENSSETDWLSSALKPFAPFIFSGALLGLMPLWNSAIFVSAFAVLAFLFILFPLKKQMIALAATTAIIALPQVIFLRTGNTRETGSLFHWGYIIDNPTVFNIIKYLAFTFGFKWILIAVALYFATWFQRRVIIAVSSLLVVTFFFKFSDEVLTNHKFINIWLIVVNLFVAYGFWRLWNSNLLKNALTGKVLSVALIALIAIGGIIDLFPIRNSYWVELPFANDNLITWIREQTDPRAIFLSNRYVNHPILIAGRRLFYGHSYYAWGAGYRTSERDQVYKKMFETKDPQELLRLLDENNISYVAIDNSLRNDDFIKNLNESLYERYFEIPFEDTEGKYDGLKIFKIPETLTNIVPLNPDESESNVDDNFHSVNAFAGGPGKVRGQFDKPRGIAVDESGNFYVADNGNARIQKFSPDGDFVTVFGKRGTGEGELREPNGIAVDSKGDIYVVDALNNLLIKFKADGSFIKQWSGPDPGFYGPRDVAIGADKQLYILDQGRSRVVKFNPENRTFAEWGKKGSADGEFGEPTGLAVGGGYVFVTDTGNNRIQVFDLNGKFVRQWDVAVWDRYLWHYPDAVFDEQTKHLYVTSGWTKEVLVYDLDGNRLDSLAPAQSTPLENPSSLALGVKKGKKRLYVVNTEGARISFFDLPEQSKSQ